MTRLALILTLSLSAYYATHISRHGSDWGVAVEWMIIR